MGTIWLGLKIGVGFAVGLLLVYYIWHELLAVPETRRVLRFHKAGFDWAEGPQEWLSRDPNNDDWILWDERNERMLRATDPDPNGGLQGKLSINVLPWGNSIANRCGFSALFGPIPILVS